VLVTTVLARHVTPKGFDGSAQVIFIAITIFVICEIYDMQGESSAFGADSKLTEKIAKAPKDRHLPVLQAKKRPAQQRAAETYERILEATALVLVDVGIERLSTNLVCERARLSPPALYQYFPNKYALLSELGQRLMQRQNEIVPRWISLEILQGPVTGVEEALAGLLLDTYRVTRETVGGVWIMRALRAVPALQQVRVASHTQMTDEHTALLSRALPDARTDELRVVVRIVVELVYASVEMLFDEPLDQEAVSRTVAAMLASQLVRLRAASSE
jgi:AcrR family transcriptional regulator